VVEELNLGVVQRIYTYGLQRISQQQVISGTWTPNFYGYDGGGSVRLLTDATGTVTDTYDYDAWGSAINTTGSSSNVYLYRGEQYDPDLNLYYVRARYLSPLTGRFLTRDPESGKIVDPRTLHKYLYAASDPVNRLDPSGRENLWFRAIITGIVVYVVGSIVGPPIVRGISAAIEWVWLKVERVLQCGVLGYLPGSCPLP
jgi:RHS repeat-associated protein